MTLNNCIKSEILSHIQKCTSLNNVMHSKLAHIFYLKIEGYQIHIHLMSDRTKWGAENRRSVSDLILHEKSL